MKYRYSRFILGVIILLLGGWLLVRLTRLARWRRSQRTGTPPPRITFIGSRGIPATYGGVERYIEEVSTRLAERGYQVSVYCRPHYSHRRGYYQGVTLRHLPCINTKHLEAISHTFVATLHALFSKDDIIHYQALGPSLLVWLPRLMGHRTVVTIQGLDWQRRKWGRLAQQVLKIGEWVSAYLPQRTIVVSRYLEEYYRQLYAKKVIYIPNGVKRNQCRPANAIHNFGLQGGDYILTVGRLTPEKGYHTLIEAFGRVKTDKKLVIVGGSSHTDAYVAELHRLAQGLPIIFTGYIYDEEVLAEWYSQAYLFVTASEVEVSNDN